MTILNLAKLQLIDFVMIDDQGAMVSGLGSGFTVEISKNGADLIAGAGVKGEIGSGWYKYQLTVSETDTPGPLAVKVTGAGAIQQNLIYEVRGSLFEISPGPNILTTAEAAAFLRCGESDPTMVLLLSQIDAHIKRGSGRNWAAETEIPEEAKIAARILLIRWHEDPGMLAISESDTLSGAYKAAMSQLRAMARYYHVFQGLPGAGLIPIYGASEGDSAVSLVGKVGIAGDQRSKFESLITWDGYIMQLSTENLQYKWFEVYLVPPGEMP